MGFYSGVGSPGQNPQQAGRKSSLATGDDFPNTVLQGTNLETRSVLAPSRLRLNLGHSRLSGRSCPQERRRKPETEAENWLPEDSTFMASGKTAVEEIAGEFSCWSNNLGLLHAGLWKAQEPPKVDV